MNVQGMFSVSDGFNTQIVRHHFPRMMFVCVVIAIATACTQAPLAAPTLQGPIVPTRIPTQQTTMIAMVTEEVTPEVTAHPTAEFTEVVITTEPTEEVTSPPSATAEPTLTPELTITETVTSTPTATEPFTLDPTLAPTEENLAPVVYQNTTSWYDEVIQPSPLILGKAVENTITHDEPLFLYHYYATAGELISIEMLKENEGATLDPFIIVVDPKGREVVRSTNDESTNTLSAEVRGIRLSETGQYIIVATRNTQRMGQTQGAFSLTLYSAQADETTVGTVSSTINYGTVLREALTETTPERVYTFRGIQGDQITIFMNRVNNQLDPRIYLENNTGLRLTFNDDDLSRGVIEAHITTFILPRTGYYSIVASRYAASPNYGEFELKLSKVGSVAEEDNTHYSALLDWENTRTYGENGFFYFNSAAGHLLVEDGNTTIAQALITFWLPPLEANQRLENATLRLEPCYAFGDGFTGLGPLTIYRDFFGRFDRPADFSRPFTGAEIINTQPNCDSLDVTESIELAYTDNDGLAQFRLSFRNLPSGGEQSNQDEVLFTPSLDLEISD